MSEKNKIKYEKVAKIAGIIIGIILIIGISYAVFRTTSLGQKLNTISAGKLGLRIDHEQDEITLENAYPMTQAEGNAQAPYLFDVVNEGTLDATYDLYIEVDENISTLSTSMIRYSLSMKGEKEVLVANGKLLSQEETIGKDGKILYKVDTKDIDKDKINSYKLYLWIDYGATIEQINGKTFEARTRIEAIQKVERESEVRTVDISVNQNGSAYANFYNDGTLVITGNGQIQQEPLNNLYMEKVVPFYKEVLTTMGYDVETIKTYLDCISYMTTLSNENENFYNEFYETMEVIVAKQTLEKMGYDTTNITNKTSLDAYLVANEFKDENGNNTEKGEEYVKNFEKIANEILTSTSSLPKRIIIENGITNVPNGLFTGNEEITKVVLPSSIRTIENQAFSNCSNLKSIEIPYGVMTIGEGAFGYCDNLTSITLPSSVQTIGYGAFQNCVSLEFVTLSASLKEIAQFMFTDCTSLKSISIPSSVTAIYNGAFEGCTNLTTVSIPSYGSLKTIDAYVFQDCTNLETINLPNYLTSIGQGAFKNCTGIKDLFIPGSVSRVDVNAFFGWTEIQTIRINNTENYVKNNWQNGVLLKWNGGCNAVINYLR